VKVFTCTTFNGHYPLGTAAIVVADDQGRARKMLGRELVKAGLSLRKEDEVLELDMEAPHAKVLCDGNH